jgi:hypothetical protein
LWYFTYNPLERLNLTTLTKNSYAYIKHIYQEIIKKLSIHYECDYENTTLYVYTLYNFSTKIIFGYPSAVGVNEVYDIAANQWLTKEPLPNPVDSYAHRQHNCMFRIINPPQKQTGKHPPAP